MNGDLAQRAMMSTADMNWTASPSGTVFRKRVHRVGPAESGQVTSLVRYTADASFPAHDHPDGEEILVLEGVFSDEHGDWPRGTYLLNPEGFRHAPFSREGCVLFVKLRQFPGADRDHHVIQTNERHWVSVDEPGVDIKPLYRQPGYTDEVRLERWAAATERGSLNYPDGVEYFVLDGAFEDDDGRYAKGTWLRLPVGCSHAPRTDRGCTLYIKTGGHRYLTSANE